MVKHHTVKFTLQGQTRMKRGKGILSIYGISTAGHKACDFIFLSWRKIRALFLFIYFSIPGWHTTPGATRSLSLGTSRKQKERKKEKRQRVEREEGERGETKREWETKGRHGRKRERVRESNIERKKRSNWISCHTVWWTISDWLSAAGPLGNYPDSWVAAWDETEEAEILHSRFFRGNKKREKRRQKSDAEGNLNSRF